MTNRGVAKWPRRIWGEEPQRLTVKQKLMKHIIAHPNDTNPTIEWHLNRAMQDSKR